MHGDTYQRSLKRKFEGCGNIARRLDSTVQTTEIFEDTWYSRNSEVILKWNNILQKAKYFILNIFLFL
jgi:hypothetical protein